MSVLAGCVEVTTTVEAGSTVVSVIKLSDIVVYVWISVLAGNVEVITNVEAGSTVVCVTMLSDIVV